MHSSHLSPTYAGNAITEIKEKDFIGLGSTLRVLRLASNSLSRLPQSAFKGLLSLERLDLRNNAILFLHDEAFAVGPAGLKHLDLSGNLLTKIPFMALSPIRELATLDLGRNLLVTPYDVHFSVKLQRLVI
jgi:Leucine-rich repeat (LRR) protein